MQEFVNIINQDIFRATNALWNDLKLNHPWSVGYVSALIIAKKFKNKEEWEDFYYKSGEQRLNEIKSLPENIQNELNNFQLVLNHPQKVNSYVPKLKSLNLYRGRTKDELKSKGMILLKEVKHRKPKLNITQEIAAECVRYRTICETWNGIILRENNTVKTLSQKFPNCKFSSVSADMDYAFAIDREVYHKDNRLICGLQIKPESYQWNAPYIQHARKANERKHKAYADKSGVPVFIVISKPNGEIVNKDVLIKIAHQIR